MLSLSYSTHGISVEMCVFIEFYINLTHFGPSLAIVWQDAPNKHQRCQICHPNWVRLAPNWKKSSTFWSQPWHPYLRNRLILSCDPLYRELFPLQQTSVLTTCMKTSPLCCLGLLQKALVQVQTQVQPETKVGLQCRQEESQTQALALLALQVQPWPSGKLPFECQKFAKKLTFFSTKLPLAIFLKKMIIFGNFFWKICKWQFSGGSACHFSFISHYLFLHFCSPQITTLVSTFSALTQTEEFLNPRFGRQLSSVGVLFQMEGLLSCHGNEMGMIEDTIIAMEDLQHVSLRIVSTEDADFTPKAHLDKFVPFITLAVFIELRNVLLS